VVVVTTIADARGLPPAPVRPLRSTSCSETQRMDEGRASLSHVMVSGSNIPGSAFMEELFEFVLHYAVHGGHTRGSTMEALAAEMAAVVGQGSQLPKS
jgi:hypothetical protein